MGILGKKYPLNKEEFRAARLPGQFDVKRAGKRMALTVPETWETKVHNYALLGGVINRKVKIKTHDPPNLILYIKTSHFA